MSFGIKRDNKWCLSYASLSNPFFVVSLTSMRVTLTIELDSEVLQFAEEAARERHTTVPEVVTHQLRVMARNWQESKAGKTPVTDSLRGAVKISPDFLTRAKDVWGESPDGIPLSTIIKRARGEES